MTESQLLKHDHNLQTELLLAADLGDCSLVPWGSNYTFAVPLTLPDHCHDASLYLPEIGIYKPRAGETPLWDFPSGTLFQREYAAYLVSETLGWQIVPCTIIREGPHGIGTLQTYIEPEQNTHYRTLTAQHDAQLRRMVLFDIITNNADRKSSHFFLGKLDGHLWGIDHGLTFNVQPKLRTVIWDFMGEPLEPELSDALVALYLDEYLPARLSPYLDELEIAIFRGRIDRLVSDGIYPELTSRRNIPYGW